MTLAQQFRALFAGMPNSYGTYNNINKQRDDGKRTGDPLTVRKPVTDELWEQHLNGTNGLGIVPIREDSTVMFGAIDIDVYSDLNHGKLAALMAQQDLPLVPCKTKSGGMHAYLFCVEPTPAVKMQERLRDIAARLGFGNSEIFPKQTKTTERDGGSWINMPYFGGDDTTRYAVKPNGDRYTVEEFLRVANALKAKPEFFDEGQQQQKQKKESKQQSALPDGPPCLQHLIELGFPVGTRNDGLRALGTYFRKARPGDWDECIEAANQKFFAEPLPSDEVQQLISSLKRKEYQYSCSKHPLVAHCNSVVCRTRKYGVGGGASSFPILGQLRKLLTVPPCWFLDVQTTNGEVIPLELTTDDLQDPGAFQRHCIDKLDIMPQMPSRVVWQQTIHQLLQNVDRMEPPPQDASTEGMFTDLLEQFCTGRAQAQNRDEILLGKPYTEDGRTYFRTADLMTFLTRKQFKEYKVQALAKILKVHMGAQHEQWRIGHRVVNVWSIPAFERQNEQLPVADAIDKEKTPF